MHKYTIIAGVNGAGKSTLYQLNPRLKSENRINADEVLKEQGGDWHVISDVFNAGKVAVKRLNQYLEEEISFNQETTLCGNAVIKSIMKAKEKGYIIEMHYIGLESVDLAKERVRDRVANGGHGVEEADIDRRYKQSLDNFLLVIPLCNLIAVYDNTEDFRRFAIYKDGELVRKSHKIPEWFNRITSQNE